VRPHGWRRADGVWGSWACDRCGVRIWSRRPPFVGPDGHVWRAVYEPAGVRPYGTSVGQDCEVEAVRMVVES
jgi:hypothetical protein